MFSKEFSWITTWTENGLKVHIYSIQTKFKLKDDYEHKYIRTSLKTIMLWHICQQTLSLQKNKSVIWYYQKHIFKNLFIQSFTKILIQL